MPFGSNSDVIAGAAARVDARLDSTIADFFLSDEARLDDRTRAAVRLALHGLVNGIETDLRRHAARLLAGRGDADAAEALLAAEETALPLLTEAGLLRDADLMDEVIAHIRTELLAEALPVTTGDTGRPSLLVRLAELPDSIVAGAAQALLAADSRRGSPGPMVSAEVQHRLVWLVAAAIREASPLNTAGDRALIEAVHRGVGAYDEGERPGAVAMRLVAAIDPQPAELPALLVEALGDRRPSLAASLLARAIGIDGETGRALLIEPDDERLWAALRAAGLSREEIARVALSLAEADPRRDIDAFADRLDAIAAADPAAARAAIAALMLPRNLRLAARALAGGRRP